jgi:hypothetical protein
MTSPATLVVGVVKNMPKKSQESKIYAKRLMGGKGQGAPHSVEHVQLWSVAALAVRDATPGYKARDHFRVEHGTPRRELARAILEVYKPKKTLTEDMVNGLVKRYWKLAVITLAEDQLLNKKFRTKMFDTPQERWKAADIVFPPTA